MPMSFANRIIQSWPFFFTVATVAATLVGLFWDLRSVGWRVYREYLLGIFYFAVPVIATLLVTGCSNAWRLLIMEKHCCRSLCVGNVAAAARPSGIGAPNRNSSSMLTASTA